MNKTLSSLICLGAVSFAMASETFGGIGVSLRSVQEGARVAAIIPGTPAAETKLQEGDIIIAVNGESLKEKSIAYAASLLRGKANMPLEITYVSNGKAFTESVRRVQLTVESVENGESVALKKKINQNDTDKRLVATLENGTLIKESAEKKTTSYDAVYVDKEKFDAPKAKSANVASKGVAIHEISRKSLSYSVKSSGKTTVSIINADGKTVKQIVNEKSTAGANSVSLNMEDAPKGAYVVSVEHNGSLTAKNIVLR